MAAGYDSAHLRIKHLLINGLCDQHVANLLVIAGVSRSDSENVKKLRGPRAVEECLRVLEERGKFGSGNYGLVKTMLETCKEIKLLLQIEKLEKECQETISVFQEMKNDGCSEERIYQRLLDELHEDIDDVKLQEMVTYLKTRNILTEVNREEIETPRDLFRVLEEKDELYMDNVKLLKKTLSVCDLVKCKHLVELFELETGT